MKTRVGRWAPMLLVPAMVLALAGCSGDDDDEEGGASGDQASETSSPSESPTAVTTSPPDLPVAPTVNKATGIAPDVEWDQASCATTAGKQTVEGTVTNSGDKNTGILVQVSWTNATSDVLGLGYEVLRGVKPGEDREWTIEADVAEGASQCVLFAQRGVIKK